MITYYKKRVRDKKFKKLSSPQVGTWISVVKPSKKEIKFLCEKFDLDKRSLISGLDKNELPRLDFIDDKIYLLTKDLILPRKRQTLLIVVGKSFILTLSKEKPSFFEKIIEEKVTFFTTQKLKSLIKILFLVNENLERVTGKIIKKVQIKNLKEKELSEERLKKLLEEESFLNSLMSSYQYITLTYNRAVKKINFLEDDKELLKDLIEDTDEVFSLCKSALKNISNVREYYNILLSNRLNKTINALTVFTVLISLPNLIAGIYGMNIDLPFQKDPLAFLYVTIFILISILFFGLYFKRKKII